MTSGRIAPADREHLTVWLRRFEGVEQVAFAAEACTGWRYVVECLQAAGVRAELARAGRHRRRPRPQEAGQDRPVIRTTEADVRVVRARPGSGGYGPGS